MANAWESAPLVSADSSSPAWASAPMVDQGPKNGTITAGGHSYGRATKQGDQPGQDLTHQLVRAGAVSGRDILTGVASLPLLAADAATGIVNVPIRMAGGQPLEPASSVFQQGLNELGGPVPGGELNNSERLASAATRGAVTAGTGAGMANQLAGVLPGTAGRVAESLAVNPGLQSISGATGSASGELARQKGAGAGGQLLASIAGSLAPAIAVTAAKTLMQPRTTTEAPVASGQVKQVAPADVEQASQQAAEKLGVDWTKVDNALKDRIRADVNKALSAGSDLPPEAAARNAIYESQGLKTTKALVTRNYEDALNEQNLMTTPEGGPLRRIYDDNNQVIRSKLQQLAPEGAAAVDQPTFGAQFRAPIATGERAAQSASNEAYVAAQAAEGGRNADLSRINSFLKENAGTLDNRPASAGLTSDLKKLGLMRQEPTSPEMLPTGPQFTLQKLASARAQVNEAWQTAKANGDARAVNRLNELRSIFDDVEANAGGDMYKAYRQIRTAKGGAYENNPLIDKLLSDQKGYVGTSKIEDSQVFDTAVLNSSTEQFNKTWPLLTSKAKDLTRAQLGKYIEDKVFSNMGTNERGDVVASAAKLSRALDGINPQKLEIIYGQKKAGDLQLLAKSLREISSPPRGTVPQGSAPKIEMLTRSLLGALKVGSKLPSVVGNTLGGAANMIKSGTESKMNAAAIEDAISPLGQMQQVKSPLLLQSVSPGAAPLISPLERLQSQK